MIWSHVGFLLIGVVNTMLGPLLPLLSARWALDDSQAGSLFLAQPVGAILGSMLSGSLIKRFGFTLPLTCGFGVMSISTACLGLGAWGVGVASIFGSGLALGLTIPTINLLISEINPQRRAAALNILNLVWGIGAVAGPVLLSTLSRASGLTGALLFLAVSAVMIAILLARCPAMASQAAPADEAALPPSLARLWHGTYPLLAGALVFVDIGTESATGGWIASYVQRLAPSSYFSWALAPSLFWAGLLVGRAAAPLILQHLHETKMVLAGMFVTLGGLLIILLNAEPAPVLIGAGLTGLGLAPIFPTTVALFTQRFGAESPHATSVLFILAGLGAAVFPWIVGLASSRFSELRIGLVVPLIGALVMIPLQLATMSVMASDEGQKVARNFNRDDDEET
jgi:fucose permease